jgi:hypothetical protein
LQPTKLGKLFLQPVTVSISAKILG